MSKSKSDSSPSKHITGVKLRLPDGQRQKEKVVWNTSLGGIFIEMVAPLAFGAEIDLEFTFPREVGNIRCSGFVVWSTNSAPERAPGKKGICVRLANIEISEMRRLAKAIGKNLED